MPNKIDSKISPLENWFPIFAAGEHKSSDGTVKIWTEQEIDDVISTFNQDSAAQADVVPFVVGHPKSEAPAYGWVKELKREGKLLLAKGRDVVSEFSDAVIKKRFPNRSIQLLPAKEGNWRLGHVGFLGGAAPAVKGLPAIGAAFAEHDDSMTYEFSANSYKEPKESAYSNLLRTLSSFFESLRSDERARFSEHENIRNGDMKHFYSECDSADLNGYSQRCGNNKREGESMTTNTTDTQTSQEFAELKAQSEAAIAENAKLKAMLAEQRKREALQFAESLREKGFNADIQARAAALYEHLNKEQDSSVLEFSAEQDGVESTVSVSPAKLFSELLDDALSAARPPEGELAGGDFTPGKVKNYSAPDGMTVDPEREKMHSKALEYMQENNCDYFKAIKLVESNNG